MYSETPEGAGTIIVEETRLYASHRQFYVQDSEPRGSYDDPDFWTKQASDNHLAITNGILGIGTGSFDFVRVRVEEHQTEPPLEQANWDHITEAGLDIRTNYLFIMGCISTSGLFFRVRPGHYRVRCCHADLALANDPMGDAGDWYLVQFWPSLPSAPQVLKRWAGQT